MADTDAPLSLSALVTDKFEGQVLSLTDHPLPGAPKDSLRGGHHSPESSPAG